MKSVSFYQEVALLVMKSSFYYPEVALDLVPTEKEFNKMKHLSSGERLLLIMDGNESKLKRLNEPSKGLEKITFNK